MLEGTGGVGTWGLGDLGMGGLGTAVGYDHFSGWLDMVTSMPIILFTLAIGGWRLAVGCWSLAVGLWPLDVGWLLTANNKLISLFY